MDWKPKISFDEGIEKTVEWYLKHEEIWKDLSPKHIRFNSLEELDLILYVVYAIIDERYYSSWRTWN